MWYLFLSQSRHDWLYCRRCSLFLAEKECMNNNSLWARTNLLGQLVLVLVSLISWLIFSKGTKDSGSRYKKSPNQMQFAKHFWKSRMGGEKWVARLKLLQLLNLHLIWGRKNPKDLLVSIEIVLNFGKSDPKSNAKKKHKMDSSRSDYIDFQYETSTGFNRNQ